MPLDVPDITIGRSLFAEDNELAPTRIYDIHISYDTDEGILQMPVAGGPAANAVIIQACSPYGRKIVDWAVERYGAKPVYPSPAPPSSTQVLKWKRITLQSSVLAPDGTTQIYRATGQFIYYLTVPLDEDDNLPFGAPPNMTLTIADNVVNPSDWKEGIIG